MARLAIRMSYDGGNFLGWWRQPQGRTVAGVWDACLSRIGEEDTSQRLIGAARTDSGVHARGQTAQLDTLRDWQPEEFHKQIQKQLPSDCRCEAVCLAPTDWACGP